MNNITEGIGTFYFKKYPNTLQANPTSASPDTFFSWNQFHEKFHEIDFTKKIFDDEKITYLFQIELIWEITIAVHA